MKIIEFLVVIYFSIFKKYGLKGVEAGIYFLLFPLTFNILSLLFYLSYLISNKEGNLISPFAIFVIGLVIAFGLRKLLNKIYLTKYEQIKVSREKYPRILLVLVPIVHWLISVFLVVYCLNFT